MTLSPARQRYADRMAAQREASQENAELAGLRVIARGRASQALKRRHEKEFAKLFAEELDSLLTHRDECRKRQEAQP